ncbi:hypothetical protein GCM10011571_15870 [Marinithermofilum abyssi]|uniref:Uncharacterized protein n=1 Tax=Marinithermofilum abyssi TaxID=1571185 RepID=A0A8J2VCT3_9BACL|nr:hypothetical protein GCM10011571_15870 [Marinithermofilum abyssi]
MVWREVNPEEPHDDALAKGCVRFKRLEGAFFADGAFWFDDTAGGEKRLGQIYHYIPATETLELFAEGTDANQMESPDKSASHPGVICGLWKTEITETGSWALRPTGRYMSLAATV